MQLNIDHSIRQMLEKNWRAKWRITLAGLLLYVNYKAFSAPGGTAMFEQMDKVLHVSAFAGLACVASWSWAPSRPMAWRVGLGLALYGALIELVQSQLPLREASWGDGVADVVGITLGLLFAHGVRARWAKPST